MGRENPVIATLSSMWPLSEITCKALLEHIKFEILPKGSSLLLNGSIQKNMYFIGKGLARVYYLKDGLDVTDYFAMDYQFIGAMASLFFSKPAHKGIELLEDSEVYTLRYSVLEELSLQFHDLERAARKMSQFAMVEEQQRIESIRFLSVKERYFELENKYKGITNRAPLKHIASYLNTSNVSISRIRAGKQ